jgi:hypothetical protein
MPETRSPSSLALWLEGALTGFALPMMAIVVAAIGAALYMAGILSEGWTAAFVVIAVAVAAAGYLVREALSPRADDVARRLLWGTAAGVLLLTAVPAFRTVVPGAPEAAGELGVVGDTLPVPHAGTVRVLVQGTLPEAGAPVISFRLAGITPPAEAKLERTYSFARVGRGGRTRVAHDHTSTYLEGKVADGGALRLERLSGEPAGPLRVAVFPEPLPTWVFVALAVLVAALAAVADARLRSGNAAAVAGMALAFGILVTENATPATAVGTTVGSILLGAIAGALGGALLAFVAKRFVAPSAAARAARR